MINLKRYQQYQNTMEDLGWDLLLLYGHSWRKDFFRSLFNFSFFGPHAIVALTPSGDITIIVSHKWDYEQIEQDLENHRGNVKLILDFEFNKVIEQFISKHSTAKTAVAGLELMETRFVHTLQQQLDHEPISATAQIEKLRQTKTTEEISAIKKAVELADIGYQFFADTVKVGMAEFELVAEVEAFLKSRGAEDNFMLIASGGIEVYGMRPPNERCFEVGDNIITELSPQVDGYFAQICRTLVLGEPTIEQQQSFTVFRDAQQAAEDYLKPGVNISDVARVQNDVFRSAGYGEYTTSQYTRVRGHNLGLHPDEFPYVLEDVDCIVTENMVLIAHPNTYLPLSGYMVFGDTLLVTTDGCERLGQTKKELFIKEV